MGCCCSGRVRSGALRPAVAQRPRVIAGASKVDPVFRDRFFAEPDRQTATLAQASIIFRQFVTRSCCLGM